MTVQTVEALDENMDQLCEIMATGEPVLVLGPGCQRIGYDRSDSPAWSELRRRMQLLHATIDQSERPFLTQLWRSKFSDVALSRDGDDRSLPESAALDAEPEGRPLLTDDLRIRGLATPVLRTLIRCTRYLGKVIETGDIPVLSWQEVQHPQDSAPDRLPAHASFMETVAVALALNKWYGTGKPESDALTGFGFEAQGGPKNPELAQALRRLLAVMEIKAVALSSQSFAQSILAGRGHTLSGANIEWLADLLWHIVGCDSGVALSQSELAFCVNLRDHAPWSGRHFTRARPGEYRDSQRPESQTRHAELTKRVRRRLLSSSFNGLEGRGEWDFKRDQRLFVTLTLAATLVQMWRNEDRTLVPLALVGSHDLMLERQVHELLEPGETFHTIVPAWVSTSDRSASTMTWLWGTYTKDATKNFDPESLRRSGDDGILEWGWYRELGPDRRKIEGPVIVRIAGSPLLDLGKNATTSTVGLEPRIDPIDGPSEERIELATIFSEFDSLAAMITLAGNGEDREEGVALSIVQSLNWERRSWAFFGDSFPDWIPRVRLLFNARTVLGGKATSTAEGKSRRPGPQRHASPSTRAKVALDLEFDWPEQAMLEALNVRPLRGDLESLARYTTAPIGQEDESLQPFLRAVRAMQRRYRDHDHGGDT